MKIRGIRPIDRAAREAIERSIQRVFSVRTPRGQHGAASYQRGEQMANRRWLIADGEWLNAVSSGFDGRLAHQ
jgi:hypothetical protein